MRGHIRKRGKSSWEVRIETGKDARGSRVFDYVTVHGPREEAEKEVTRRMKEVHDGAYVESSKITAGEFFDRWLATYAEMNVSPKTYEGYKSIVEQHFKPAFGSFPLQKLTAFQIQSHYARVQKEGGRKDGRKGGISACTVLHQHRLLSQALGMAIRWQLLVRNPCDGVVPPKMDQREVQVIDETEAAWLIRAAEGTRLYLPILMTTCAGLRRGEILAATWSNVDKERRILWIARAVSEPNKNTVLFKKPKGKRTRNVALPPLLLEALEEHRQEQEKNREALGAAYNDNDLICCQADGSIWRPSAFTSSYRALLVRRSLAGPNFHALRHSHASQMLRDGVDIKTVSARLGHSKASFTLAQYCHLMPGQDREAADRTELAMRKALDETRPHKVM